MLTTKLQFFPIEYDCKSRSSYFHRGIDSIPGKPIFLMAFIVAIILIVRRIGEKNETFETGDN